MNILKNVYIYIHSVCSLFTFFHLKQQFIGPAPHESQNPVRLGWLEDVGWGKSLKDFLKENSGTKIEWYIYIHTYYISVVKPNSNFDRFLCHQFDQLDNLFRGTTLWKEIWCFDIKHICRMCHNIRTKLSNAFTLKNKIPPKTGWEERPDQILGVKTPSLGAIAIYFHYLLVSNKLRSFILPAPFVKLRA